MNTERVRKALDDIDRYQAALGWLQEHGAKIESRNNTDDAGDQATVVINLFLAARCRGADEARGILANYARIDLPKAVQAAIRCCENTLIIAKDILGEELAKP